MAYHDKYHLHMYDFWGSPIYRNQCPKQAVRVAFCWVRLKMGYPKIIQNWSLLGAKNMILRSTVLRNHHMGSHRALSETWFNDKPVDFWANVQTKPTPQHQLMMCSQLFGVPTSDPATLGTTGSWDTRGPRPGKFGLLGKVGWGPYLVG